MIAHRRESGWVAAIWPRLIMPAARGELVGGRNLALFDGCRILG